MIINGDVFEYEKKINIFNIKKNVRIDDVKNNNSLFSDHIVYNKDKEIFSKGSTEAIIDQKYNFYSTNLYYLKKRTEYIQMIEAKLKIM